MAALEEEGEAIAEGGPAAEEGRSHGGEEGEQEEDEEEEEEEEDEDALLDLLADSMRSRLLNGGSDATTSAKRVEEGRVMLLDDDFDRSEDGALADETVTWKPETGLLTDEREGASLSAKLNAQNVKKKGPKWILEEDLEKKLVAPPRDPRKELREQRKNAPQTAGLKWYDLPATSLTPELKTELQLLKLRGVLDPKRHYKSEDSKKFPKHFQIGTVVEGAADFYSGRLTRKERKSSFADELLHDSQLKEYRKRKYSEIQAEKDRGSRRHLKKQKEKRKPKWARP